jgi:L-iditol 2-dehydrogenase
MRALMLHGPDDLRLEEVPRPDPGPGELVIRVAVALTCATDRKILARGVHPSIGPVPAAFGHEGAGTVAALGAGLNGLALGDRVVPANSAPCGDCEWCLADRAGLCSGITYLSGTYAEYLRVPAQIARVNVLPVPDGLDWALAALAEPVACAIRGADRSRVQPGEHAVILGGGLQGLVLCTVLARRGCRVIVCDPHADRRELAVRMGAAETADAPRDAAALARLRARTPGGHGAHAVFAAVGAVQVWEQAVAVARPGGEVNFHGGPAPGAVFSSPADRLHYEELTLQASYHHTPATFRAALAMIDAERDLFAEFLGGEVALEEVAHALAAGGPKHVVRPGPPTH